MALTPEQRAELEELGADTVRAKLSHAVMGPGQGADILGFTTGMGGGGAIRRGLIEGWLAEQHGREEKRQESILFWARLAGITAIVGVIVTIATAIWHR